eukprot:scaffold8374_cov175-Amphora_coffeaeformis.AAC.69
MDRSMFPNQQGVIPGYRNMGNVPAPAPHDESKDDSLDLSLIAALFRDRLPFRQGSNAQGSSQNSGIERSSRIENLEEASRGAYTGNLNPRSLQNALRTSAPTLSPSHSNSSSSPSRASPPMGTAEMLLRLQLDSHRLANQEIRSPLFLASPEPALRNDNLVQRILARQLVATFPNSDSSGGLSLNQILALFRQQQQIQGLQQVAGVPDRQRHFNNAGSIESLANRLLSSGATPSPSLLTANPFQLLLLPHANPLDNTLSFEGSSLLDHLSTAAPSQTTPIPASKPPGMEDTPSHPPREPSLGSSSHIGSSEDKKNVKKPARRKRNSSDTTTDSGLAAEPTSKRKKRAYHHESFPVKLYRLLRETEEAGKSDIISFSEDGKRFCVHKPAELETEILPKYFRHNQLSSFRRLLNMYGFARLQEGAEGGTFRHPSFIKGKPEICKDLDRVR